jgi:hypothetical protein
VAPGPARGADRPTLRGALRRRRLAVLRAGLTVTLPLAAVGALLVAPHDLAAIRLAGVGLGWWAAAAAGGAALVALALGLAAERGERRGTRRGGPGEERAAPPGLREEAVRASRERGEPRETRRGGPGDERAAPPRPH